MEQRTLNVPDPVPAPAHAERRHRLRQKLYSPVYASFRSPQAGMVVDLSELLDLHEDGFAVHTAEPLEVNRPVALTLDLPETKSYIHGHGLVVWSDSSGRGGIRFSDLSETSRRLLKEWLFANLLVASAHHAARSEQRLRYEEAVAEPEAPSDASPPALVADSSALPVDASVDQDEHPSPRDAAVPEELRSPLAAPVEAGVPALSADLSVLLSAVETVRQRIRAGVEEPAALQLIAQCALELTGASGTALALLTDGEMICRATCGETAPPLGTPVDVKQGLSGECIRSGQMIHSEDTENDSRVDRELCRALGIGSILATPVVADFRVVGLLEVFSPRPHAFSKTDETVLDRLAEAVPKVHPEPPMRQDAATGKVLPPSSEPAAEADAAMYPVRDALWEEAEEPKRRHDWIKPANLYIGLMALVVAVTAMAAGYLLAPAIQRHWLRSSGQPAARSTVVEASPQATAGRSAMASSPEELRKLAEAGDAEAQYWLAIRYSTGTTVLQDDAEAAKWFERAAQQGHVLAQARLGSYYWGGRGVPRDLSKAYMWARLAWTQGDEDSKAVLEGITTQMTQSEEVAARQRAEDWLRQHNQRGLSTKN